MFFFFKKLTPTYYLRSGENATDENPEGWVKVVFVFIQLSLAAKNNSNIILGEGSRRHPELREPRWVHGGCARP